MKTGIFSGSFNPVHTGHLILANWLCQFHGLEEVWFLVSPQNPLKEAAGLAPETDRVRMVDLAIEAFPRFRNDRTELELPRPSYTVRTLETLQERHPDRRFALIVGADNWTRFDRWFEADRLKSRFDLLVYPRRGYPIEIGETDRKRVQAVDAPLVELSSTFIREGIAAGKQMNFFLPERVCDYIEKRGLYRQVP